MLIHIMGDDNAARAHRFVSAAFLKGRNIREAEAESQDFESDLCMILKRVFQARKILSLISALSI